MKVPGQSVGRIVMFFKPLLDWMCSVVGFIQVAGSVLSIVWIVFSSKLSFTQEPKMFPPHCNDLFAGQRH